jgi:hypothetical protein
VWIKLKGKVTKAGKTYRGVVDFKPEDALPLIAAGSAEEVPAPAPEPRRRRFAADAEGEA